MIGPFSSATATACATHIPSFLIATNTGVLAFLGGFRPHKQNLGMKPWKRPGPHTGKRYKKATWQVLL